MSATQPNLLIFDSDRRQLKRSWLHFQSSRRSHHTKGRSNKGPFDLVVRIIATSNPASEMMFENPEIAHDDLPQADSVTWLGMDEKFVRRLLTQTALALVFVIIGLGGLQFVFSVAFADDNMDISFGWLWLLIPVVAVPLFVWPLISVPRKGYAIRDKDIIYKSGVFWHTVTAIPFNRIQHVEKSSTPLDRRFEIATLQLFTAGGSGGDLKIHGLSADIAEKLRLFILDKVGASVERR
jgi:hypothetical protein